MAVAPSYPGVYIEEAPGAVRTIAGVPTSITAFIGRRSAARRMNRC
jgi:phage tail sheath protein FI